MNLATIQRLDELFGDMPILRGGEVLASEIDSAERCVGVRFAPDYREFLMRYGGAMVGSLPVLGLRRAEVMGDDMFSVVDVTNRFRDDGWESAGIWVIISMDLSGNPIGLTSTGEVWVSDHDARETRMVAATFEDFVVQLLDESGLV